ncbi:hypothetical protein E2C01_038667 [Portunus trituberculatus]|uniref:Uncharacterized protein n=1 Tax=Portunus trituberculatus TaxID=210409 RepID=A0A5B7FKP1_PORTR|nr:hypothetical protein [Portunus trituberculatus]
MKTTCLYPISSCHHPGPPHHTITHRRRRRHSMGTPADLPIVASERENVGGKGRGWFPFTEDMAAPLPSPLWSWEGGGPQRSHKVLFPSYGGEVGRVGRAILIHICEQVSNDKEEEEEEVVV